MKKFKKGLLAIGMSLLLGGAILGGVSNGNVLHEADAADSTTTEDTTYWGISGYLGGSTTWTDDVYTVNDDGASTMTVALTAGDIFKFRANGAWDKTIGYSDLTGTDKGVNFTGSTSAITEHLTAAPSDNNVEVLIGGNYTFTFPDGSATSWTYGYQYGMTIAYEAFASSYTVTKVTVLDGVEQPQLEATQTFLEEGKTLADVTTGVYGFAFSNYVVGETTYTSETASTYTIASDVTVTLNYTTSGEKTTYLVDYSLAAEAFAGTVYAHYWSGTGWTTFPGIIVSAADNVASVTVPSEVTGFNISNGTVQSSDILTEGATDRYVLDGNTDTIGHYTGAWESASYRVIVNNVIDGVAQDGYLSIIPDGSTYGDLALSVYGYVVSTYTVGESELAEEVQATDLITSDVTVTITYVDDGEKNTYEIDYSAVAEAFGENAYIHYWREAVESETDPVAYAGTEWPGIKVAPVSGVVTVDIPVDADYMILNNGTDPAVQTTNISLAGATNKYVVGTTQDASGNYEGSWEGGITVTINRVINGVEQDATTETVASGTILSALTTTAVYGYTISSYEIGGAAVEASTAITESIAVTVNYAAVEGSLTYTIDFTASPVPEASAFFYAHIWRTASETVEAASSDIKLAATAEQIVTIVVPNDANGFIVWNSPDEGYRAWQTFDIVPSGVDNDVYKIRGVDSTSYSLPQYYGYWESGVDGFVSTFFAKTAVCAMNGNTDMASLVVGWADIETAWNALESNQKEIIKSTAADYSETAVNTVAGLVARYDYIVAKYGGIEGITDFMDRQPQSNQIYTNGVSEEDASTLLTFAVVIGALALIGVGIGFILRRREA